MLVGAILYISSKQVNGNVSLFCFSIGKYVCFINKIDPTFKSFALYFESIYDYSVISKALNTGKQWACHNKFCLSNNMKPNNDILKWIIDSSNERNMEKGSFQIDLAFILKKTTPLEYNSLKYFLGNFKNIWAISFTSQKELNFLEFNI